MKKVILLILEICAVVYGFTLGVIALVLFIERIIRKREKVRRLVTKSNNDGRPMFL